MPPTAGPKEARTAEPVRPKANHSLLPRPHLPSNVADGRCLRKAGSSGDGPRDFCVRGRRVLLVAAAAAGGSLFGRGNLFTSPNIQ